MSELKLKYLKIMLTIFAENLPRITCKYYQGDEEPCLRGEHFLCCNCDGQIKKCEFLQDYNMKHFKEEEGP